MSGRGNVKQAMVDYMQKPLFDDLYTPDEAILPLLKYIKPSWTVWEPTDFGGSRITAMLKANGNSVITSHIQDGQSFFDYTPQGNYNIIITNPPYSLKTEFLGRLYSIGKPFAVLLPITALEGIERGRLYRDYGIEVLVLDRRVNFMKQKKNNWFNTSWFCSNILPERLIFAEVSRNDRTTHKINTT